MIVNSAATRWPAKASVAGAEGGVLQRREETVAVLAYMPTSSSGFFK